MQQGGTKNKWAAQQIYHISLQTSCLIQETAQIELAFKIFAELTVVLLEPAKAAMTSPLVQARMRAKKNGVT